MEDKINALRAEYKDLQDKLQDPNIFSDPAYPKLAKTPPKNSANKIYIAS